MHQTNVTKLFSRDIFRIVRFFLGINIYALGVVMTLQANIGYSPWYVFHHGIALNLGLTIGQAGILVSTSMVLIAVFMKEQVGIATLINMVLIGIFIDTYLFLNWIPLMQSFVPGVVMMISGLFILAIATFLYMGAGYGAGPRDSFMVVLTKKTGKPVGLCRSCLEGTVLFTGWLLGGYVGIGTVIAVFGIGVAVQVVFSVLSFDVKAVHQESCYETFQRLRGMLKQIPNE